MTLTTKTVVDQREEAGIYDCPPAPKGKRPDARGALDPNRNRKAGRERYQRPDGSFGWRLIRKTNQ